MELQTMSSQPNCRRGFTLIELLVTLVIGMIAVIVMLQILSSAEGRKRTTTGGDSAQNTGALALYELQRGLRQAGHGINAARVIGCNVTLRSGVTLNNMGPVVINHPDIPTAARDANTDTLLIAYSSSSDAPEGDKIEDKLVTAQYTLAGFSDAASAPSFAAGDRVIAQTAIRPSPCALSVETVTSVAGQTVNVGTGVAGTIGGNLYNLGQTPSVAVYAVKDARLTRCDYMVNNCAATTYNAAHWSPVGGNVVSLRAQYGNDSSAPMDGTVDGYNQTTPGTMCNWLRMRAVRVALVARSAQLENTATASAPTATAPTWAAGVSVPINLSGDSNWQRYRYKTFETTVPLRNVAWMEAESTC